MSWHRAMALAVLGGAAACSGGPPREIRIGLLATFAGPFAGTSGVPTREGAQLAVREAGGAIELGGRRYRITRVERPGSDSWDPGSLPALLPGQRAFVTAQWQPDLPTPDGVGFRTAYRAAFGVEPRATAALTYDATRLVTVQLVGP